MAELNHIGADGAARMVDVSGKQPGVRTAVATGLVRTAATSAIREGTVAKGDVVACARIAGIMAAKRTPDLIPMCHPIAVHAVTVDVVPDPELDLVRIRAEVRTADRTGVEMEALTAVTVAALTVVDMTKAVDPAAVLDQIQVESKTGGKNGDWVR